MAASKLSPHVNITQHVSVVLAFVSLSCQVGVVHLYHLRCCLTCLMSPLFSCTEETSGEEEEEEEEGDWVEGTADILDTCECACAHAMSPMVHTSLSPSPSPSTSATDAIGAASSADLAEARKYHLKKIFE